MRAATRWEIWRGDSEAEMLRSTARDLDDHDRTLADHAGQMERIDERFDALQRTLIGFIISAAGLTIAAAINIVVLVWKG